MFQPVYSQERVPAASLFVDLLKLSPRPYSVPFDVLAVLDEPDEGSGKRWGTLDSRVNSTIFAVAVDCSVEIQLREPGTFREVHAVEVWGALGAYYGQKVRAIKLGELLLTAHITPSREATIQVNADGERELEPLQYATLARMIKTVLKLDCNLDLEEGLDEIVVSFPSGTAPLSSLLYRRRQVTSMVVYTGPHTFIDYLGHVLLTA